MPIVAQQTVSGDAKYTIKADRSLTTYDIHNDSPFNVGISLGQDVGILNADFYMSPHTILEGIQPVGLSQRVVNSQVWSGTLFVYTQTPTGGTIPSNAPANTITVIGYPTGGAPVGGGYGINRLQNTGNTVNTVGGNSNKVQDDVDVAGTVFVESTVNGDVSSSVKLTVDGNLTLGNATHHGSISSDNGAVTTDGSGNVTTNNITVATGKKIVTPEVDSPAATDLVVNVPTGQNVIINVNNVQKLKIDASGNVLCSGLIGVTANGDVIDGASTVATYLKSRNSGGSVHIQIPNGTSIADFLGTTTAAGGANGAGGSLTVDKVFFNIGGIKDIKAGASLAGTVNHGLSGVPAAVMATCNASPSTQTTGADTYTSTQFTMRSGAALSNEWFAFR